MPELELTRYVQVDAQDDGLDYSDFLVDAHHDALARAMQALVGGVDYPATINPRTPGQAVHNADVSIGHRWGAGQCEALVRTFNGFTQGVYGSAAEHYADIPAKFRLGVDELRAGDIAYWAIGRNGHTAEVTGTGTVVSPDIVRVGLISEVPYSRISSQWGARALGGARAYWKNRPLFVPPAPPTPTPVPVPKPVPVPAHRKDHVMMTIIVGRTGYVWTGNPDDKPARIDLSYDPALKGPSKLWADVLTQFPGTPVAIPLGMDPPHPLSVALGFEPAKP